MAFKLPSLNDTPTINPSHHQSSGGLSQWYNNTVLDDFDDMPDFDASDIFKELPFLQDDVEDQEQQQQHQVSEVVVTCTGNINDADLQDKLKSIQEKISLIAKTDQEDVVISKVEPWNSIRVTFNIPPDAAIRLRHLAQNGDHALQQLGILSVQIEQGDIIQVPASAAAGQPQQQARQQVTTAPSMAEPAGLPVPASSVLPTPVLTGRFPSELMAIQQSSLLAGGTTSGIPQPSTPQPMQGMPSSHMRPPMVSQTQLQQQQLQQQQQQSNQQQQVTAGMFGGQQQLQQPPQQPQQQPNPGMSWGGMQETQQRQQQMRQNIWNQMPIPNLVPFNMPSGIPPQQQQPLIEKPKKKPKKRIRKKKKEEPPRPPVGQPLMPVPDVPQLPHILNNPQTNDFAKPPDLSLPASIVNNPISPNISPAPQSVASTVPSAMPQQGSQFPFIDVQQLQRQLASNGQPPTTITQAQITMIQQQQQQLHRQLTQSGHSQSTITQAQLSLLQQQQQQLQRKPDVTLTSPLLVNLLQNEITTTQFPFVNPAGKGINTATTTMASQDGQINIAGNGIPGMTSTATTITSSSMPNVSLGLAMQQLASLNQANQQMSTTQQTMTSQQSGLMTSQSHMGQPGTTTLSAASTSVQVSSQSGMMTSQGAPQYSQAHMMAAATSQAGQTTTQANQLISQAGAGSGQISSQALQMMSQAGPVQTQAGGQAAQVGGQIQPQPIQGIPQQSQGMQPSQPNQAGMHPSQLPRYSLPGVPSQPGQLSPHQQGQQMMQLGQRLPRPYQIPKHPGQMSMQQQMMLQQQQQQQGQRLNQPNQMMHQQQGSHQGQMMQLGGGPMSSAHMQQQMTSQTGQMLGQHGQLQQQQHPGQRLHHQGQMSPQQQQQAINQMQSQYGNQMSAQQQPGQMNQMNPQMMRQMALQQQQQQQQQRMPQTTQRFPQPGQRYHPPNMTQANQMQQQHIRPPPNPMTSSQPGGGNAMAQFNQMASEMQQAGQLGPMTTSQASAMQPGQPSLTGGQQISTQASSQPGQIATQASQMSTQASRMPGHQQGVQVSQSSQIRFQSQLQSQLQGQLQGQMQGQITTQQNQPPTTQAQLASQKVSSQQSATQQSATLAQQSATLAQQTQAAMSGAMTSQSAGQQQQLAKLHQMTSQAGMGSMIQQQQQLQQQQQQQQHDIRATTPSPTIQQKQQQQQQQQHGIRATTPTPSPTTSTTHSGIQTHPPGAPSVSQMGTSSQQQPFVSTQSGPKGGIPHPNHPMTQANPLGSTPTSIEQFSSGSMYKGPTPSSAPGPFTMPERPARGRGSRGPRGRGRGRGRGQGGTLQRAPRPVPAADLPVPPVHAAIPEREIPPPAPAFDEESALASMTEEERHVMGIAAKIAMEAKRDSTPSPKPQASPMQSPPPSPMQLQQQSPVPLQPPSPMQLQQQQVAAMQQQAMQQQMQQRSEPGYVSANVERASPVPTRVASPRIASPRGSSSSRGPSPVSQYMGASPRAASPRISSPGAHRGTSPRSSSPRVASPRSPRSSSPRGTPSPSIANQGFPVKSESGPMLQQHHPHLPGYGQGSSLPNTSTSQHASYIGHPSRPVQGTRQPPSPSVTSSSSPYPPGNLALHAADSMALKPESSVLPPSSQITSSAGFDPSKMTLTGPNQHGLSTQGGQFLPGPTPEQYRRLASSGQSAPMSAAGDVTYSMAGVPNAAGMMQGQQHQIGLQGQQQQVPMSQFPGMQQASKPPEVRIPNPSHQGMQSVPPLPDAENFAKEIQRLAFDMGVNMQRSMGQDSSAAAGAPTPRGMNAKGLSFMHKHTTPPPSKKPRTATSPKGDTPAQQSEEDSRLKALLSEIQPDACPVKGKTTFVPATTGGSYGLGSGGTCPMTDLSSLGHPHQPNTQAAAANAADKAAQLTAAFLHQHQQSQQMSAPQLSASDAQTMETLFGPTLDSAAISKHKQPSLPLLTSAIKDTFVDPLTPMSMPTSMQSSHQSAPIASTTLATTSHSVLPPQHGISTSDHQAPRFPIPSPLTGAPNSTGVLHSTHHPATVSKAAVVSQYLPVSSAAAGMMHSQMPASALSTQATPSSFQRNIPGASSSSSSLQGNLHSHAASVLATETTGLSQPTHTAETTKQPAGEMSQSISQSQQMTTAKTNSASAAAVKENESCSVQSDGKCSPETILSGRSTSPAAVSPGSASSSFSTTSSASALLSSMAKTAASGTSAIPSISPVTDNQQASGGMEEMDAIASNALDTGAIQPAPTLAPDSALEALKQTTQNMTHKAEETDMPAALDGMVSASPGGDDVAPTLPKMQQQPDTLRVKSMSAPKSPRSPGEPPKLVPQSIMSAPSACTATLTKPSQSSFVAKPSMLASSAPVLKPQMSAPMPTSLKSTLPSLDYAPKSKLAQGMMSLPQESPEDTMESTQSSMEGQIKLQEQQNSPVARPLSAPVRQMQKLPGETQPVQPYESLTGTETASGAAPGVSVSEFYRSKSHMPAPITTKPNTDKANPVPSVPMSSPGAKESLPISKTEGDAKERKRSRSGEDDDEDDRPLKQFKDDKKNETQFDIPGPPAPLSRSASPNVTAKQGSSSVRPAAISLRRLSESRADISKKDPDTTSSHVRTRSSSGSTSKDDAPQAVATRARTHETESTPEQPTRTLRQRPDSSAKNTPGRRSPAEMMRGRDEASPSTRRSLRGERDQSPETPATRKRSTRSVAKVNVNHGRKPAQKCRRSSRINGKRWSVS